jgi:hypothetical protein
MLFDHFFNIFRIDYVPCCFRVSSKTYGIDGGTGLIFTGSGTEILGKGTVTSYNQEGWAVSKSKQLP